LLDFLGTLQRTHNCGELRAANAGESVILMGWVNRRRDHGNLIFLDLRDRFGITQVVLDAELSPDGHAKAEHVRPEYVVAAIGRVRLRGKDVINPKMETGEIEIVAEQLLVLNDAKTRALLPRRRGDRQRRSPPEVPLSRPAPPEMQFNSQDAARHRAGDSAVSCRARDFSKSRRPS
jgi:aspartyl-tRNA synthetase